MTHAIEIVMLNCMAINLAAAERQREIAKQITDPDLKSLALDTASNCLRNAEEWQRRIEKGKQ